jgi:hypothetical protein
MWITYDQLQRILRAKSLRLNKETALRLKHEDFLENKSEIEYIYNKANHKGNSILRYGVIIGKYNNVIRIRWKDEWNDLLGEEEDIWITDLINRGWFIDIREEVFEKILIKGKFR